MVAGALWKVHPTKNWLGTNLMDSRERPGKDKIGTGLTQLKRPKS